ncbi:MAG TPA: GNAT family N-acetyltransferase [Rubricoccaceae bacterium]|jgi:aminoglycoside 6'-N-acetyltransferase
MTTFTFRPLSRADFPLLGTWLARPHVARWWADDPSPEGVEEKHGGVVDGTEPAEVFVADLDGRPVGLAQRYRIEAYPDSLAELEAVLPVPPHAASIDYLVGEPDALGRGLGAEMIGRFTETLWRDYPDAPAVVVPVHAENAASWRALGRAGYRLVARGPLEPDNPEDTPDHVVYQIDRPSDPYAPPPRPL